MICKKCYPIEGTSCSYNKRCSCNCHEPQLKDQIIDSITKNLPGLPEKMQNIDAPKEANFLQVGDTIECSSCRPEKGFSDCNLVYKAHGMKCKCICHNPKEVITGELPTSPFSISEMIRLAIQAERNRIERVIEGMKASVKPIVYLGRMTEVTLNEFGKGWNEALEDLKEKLNEK